MLKILIAGMMMISSGAFAQGKLTPQQELEQWRQARINVYMDDFAELRRYKKADKQIGLPASGEKRVVFMGDSITDAWDFGKFFPGKNYIGRGIGGQTTTQMLARFRQDVINLHPAIVVILAGTNDIAGNTGYMDAGDTQANIQSMTELAKAHGIRVILCSVTPVNDYSERGKSASAMRPEEKILALNEWLKSYCKQEGCVYLDYFSAMVDENGKMKAGLVNDGLHPNAEGYKIMAALAQNTLDAVLKQKTAK